MSLFGTFGTGPTPSQRDAADLSFQERIERKEREAHIRFLRRMTTCVVAEVVGTLTTCVALSVHYPNALRIFFGVEGIATDVVALVCAIGSAMSRYEL
jgi:hypothetical protein